MDKKPSGISNKSNKSSERFLDRILYRFKMIKHASRNHIFNAEESIEYVPPVTPITEPTDEEEIKNEYQYDRNYRSISAEDLQPFCEQLGKFLQYVKNIQELTYFTYDYPCLLQNRLEKEANELDCLFKEVRAAVINIDRISKQRKAVRKEKSSVKKTLKKVREDESREMENFLQAYDKTMFQRWEGIKHLHKSDVLENLLLEVKAKQQALDTLSVLISRKLSSVQFFSPIPCPDISSACKANTSTANGMDDKQTTVSMKRHHHNTTSSIPRYRRRRQDGSRSAEGTSTTRTAGTQNTDNNDMSLVPFPLSNGPSSNNSLSSTSSTTWTRSSDSNNNSNNNAAEFHTEMRSVLQALFGDVRQGQGSQSQPPTTTITINDANAMATTSNTDVENSNNAIELYTIRRSPQQ